MRPRFLPKPTILGLRISALVDLYRWRLSNHKAQELLAGLGIAIGVALLFGVLVANSSLVGSASQLVHGVTGKAQFQLMARTPAGFAQRTARRAALLPGVRVGAPLLRENAVVVGPKGRESIQLIGVTGAEIALEGSATKNLGSGALIVAGGVGLPTGVAEGIGAEGNQRVTVLAAGDAHSEEVRAVLGSQTVGPVANSPIVVTLLSMAQEITGKPKRVNQVLVQPEPGDARLVEGELKRLAAGKLDVESADRELPVLKAAATPTAQSTTLFAAISAMVGFLLALNAMLLTVPERRRFVAEMRQQGFGPRQVLAILLSQALMLGACASLVGIFMGDLLSRMLFHQAPSYLTPAFPIGSQPVIPLTTILFAFASGVLATVLASMLPLLDLRPNRQADAVLHDSGEAGQSVSPRSVLAFGVLGVLLVAGVTAGVLLDPALSILGGVLLALAAFCLIPSMFVLVVSALKPLSERVKGSMLALAVVELEATATRSVALAGVAALALFGMVAIQGARRDLLSGLDAALVQYLDTADIWVTTDNNFLTINSFHADGASAAIAQQPGIASVREYQGELLDVGTRRLWIRARPAGDSALIQASQLIEGDLARATQLMRAGGWAAVSSGFATEHRLRVGSTFALPSPTGPVKLRVAAVTTNVGWAPGAITLNDSDYRAYWRTDDPTALEINLQPGVSPIAGKHEVERALASRPGLQVETFAERKSRYEESARQGIRSLSEISTLLLVATSLAIASALSAAIWQRRARLASLKSHGFDSRQLWRSLLIESTILLAVGCLDGAILGIYGHALASRWLKLSVGFPAPFALSFGLVALTLLGVIGVALAVIALPGLAAARVPPRAGFQE
ncbi:MAG TPA: FtsX-like permease family protein [Solirubrobacteraceae bacterium]|nr:FtsX-like permease family protein [Solirubrobacteraceae bacterium]